MSLVALPVAAAGVLLAPATIAQDLRVVDPTWPAAAVFDTARNRTMALGRFGETREFDGLHWRTAAVPLQTDPRPATMAYDPIGKRTLLVYATSVNPLATWWNDGTGWRQTSATGGPGILSQFVLAGDANNGGFLLFGGLGTNPPLSDDTWSFDGAAWTLRHPTNAPPARYAAASAYDSAQGRVRIFGGLDFNATLGDTWSWDGTNWTQIVTPVSPPPRANGLLAFDPLRNRTVLFGGWDFTTQFTDVWEFDGTTWLQTPSSTPGPAQTQAQFVFDHNLGECLLLGGGSSNQPGNETWAWNGVRWLQLATANRPETWLDDHIVAVPNGTGCVRVGGTPLDPTWLWDGGSWSPIAGAGPTPRTGWYGCTGSQFAYVFGGTDASTNLLGDLWGFDGTAWSQLTPVTGGPSPRASGAMAFDAGLGEVVLFGGMTSSMASGVDGETWTFDGVQWNQRSPAHSPAARFGHAMAYDFASGRTILTGGIDSTFNGFLQDTWAWDGTDWTLLSAATPAPISRPSLAFDVTLGALTLFSSHYGSVPMSAYRLGPTGWTTRGLNLGSRALQQPGSAIGFPLSNGVLLGDLSNLFSVSATQATAAGYGSACTPAAPELAAGEWPRLGAQTFGIDVLQAPSSSLVAVLGALQMASLPIAGCVQLVQPGQAVLLLPTSVTGVATMSIPIPNVPSFVGLSLYFQAAAIDPQAPAGFTLSSGLRLAIGY